MLDQMIVGNKVWVRFSDLERAFLDALERRGNDREVIRSQVLYHTLLPPPLQGEEIEFEWAILHPGSNTPDLYHGCTSCCPFPNQQPLPKDCRCERTPIGEGDELLVPAKWANSVLKLAARQILSMNCEDIASGECVVVTPAGNDYVLDADDLMRIFELKQPEPLALQAVA